MYKTFGKCKHVKRVENKELEIYAFHIRTFKNVLYLYEKPPNLHL